MILLPVMEVQLLLKIPRLVELWMKAQYCPEAQYSSGLALNCSFLSERVCRCGFHWK